MEIMYSSVQNVRKVFIVIGAVLESCCLLCNYDTSMFFCPYLLPFVAHLVFSAGE